MALIEGCRHSLEITVPAEEVARETDRAVESIRQKVRLPGFRAGKVPDSVIRARFKDDIRQDVLQALVPRALRAQVEKDNLPLVGEPSISDVHLVPGEPLRFKAEFEVVPEFELGEYQGLTVAYRPEEVREEDVDRRLERLREENAEFVAEEPRPVSHGDHAVVSLVSRAGLDGKPIEQDELTLHVGGEETLEDFTGNLMGMEPGGRKEFDVRYPDDYAQQRLAGKTIRFLVDLKEIRRRELPALNDEFAQDLGDFKTLAELRDAVRSGMRAEREFIAQQEAKTALIDQLVERHDFPIPEAFIERQIEVNVERRVRELAAQGVDPRNLRVDWDRLRESQGEQARRDVKASLILERIADREAVDVTVDEVDREVRRIAQERREPAAAVRKQLEESGEIRRIASRIRTEKTLAFLFEKARKVVA